MSPLFFLALALVISVVGTLVLWIRHREPDTPDATIDEFRSKMRALSHHEDPVGPHANGDHGATDRIRRAGRNDPSGRGG